MDKDKDEDDTESPQTPQQGWIGSENLSDDIKHKLVYFLLQKYNLDKRKCPMGK